MYHYLRFCCVNSNVRLMHKFITTQHINIFILLALYELQTKSTFFKEQPLALDSVTSMFRIFKIRFLWNIYTIRRCLNSIVLYCLRHTAIANNSCSVVGMFFSVSDSFLDQYATGLLF